MEQHLFGKPVPAFPDHAYRCPGMVKRDRPAVYPFAPIPFGAIVAAVFGIIGLVIAIRRLF
jgi:hypothetical protein